MEDSNNADNGERTQLGGVVTNKKESKISPNAWIILICTILLVVFLSGAMYVMIKYKNELTKNPFTYGAKKYAQVNQASDVYCSCIVEGINTTFTDPTFYFNSTKVWNSGKRYLPPKESEIFNATAMNALLSNVTIR